MQPIMLAQDPSRGVEIEDSIVADTAAVPTLIVQICPQQTCRTIAEPFCSLQSSNMTEKVYPLSPNF